MFSWIGFLLVPLAAASVVAGVLATRTGIRSESGIRLPAIATGAAAVVLLLGLVAPGMLRPSFVPDDGPRPSASHIEVVPLPQFGAAAIGGDWVDADKASLRQGRVRVEVAEAWLAGAPKTENPNGQRKWLHVRLRLYRSRTGEEIAAGAFAPALTWDRSHKATLRNGDGPAAAQLPVTVRGRAGHSSAVGVTFDVTDEILAFESPPSLEGLRLELPAAAWGGNGVFRFALPASFVRLAQPAPVS